MTLTVRPETADDAQAIRNVLLKAFSAPAEADLVERLRDGGDSEISLVAEQSGEIVGHVMLSRMDVSAGSRAYRALGLGPVGVLPGCQGSGVGSELIRSALAIAQALGEELVFVLGEPDYYSRFGFTREAAAPFASPYAGPYFMALWLRPDQAASAPGTAAYAPAFGALGQP